MGLIYWLLTTSWWIFNERFGKYHVEKIQQSIYIGQNQLNFLMKFAINSWEQSVDFCPQSIEFLRISAPNQWSNSPNYSMKFISYLWD